MRKHIFARGLLIAGVAALFLFSNTASAYWVWTPGTKKFINPKNAVKDSPKEQFEWAMTFYNAKDFQRAATEFDKLTKQYEYSEYASKAQYYVGLCYESMNKFYIAFQNYQKAIDNFPHIENMDEIVAREFNIANMFVTKESPKVLGADIMTSLDRAIEIYKKVVDNAPYGRLADEAQFRMGVAMKKAERYDEAIQAFQKILDDYPTSTFVDKAKFEVADCAYRASLKPAYDVEPTQKAIKAFEDFSRENRDRSLSKEADKTIQRLKDKAAEKSLLTAQFYEKQGRYQAAIIYYKDIIDTYPESSFVILSRSKIEKLTERLDRPKGKPFQFKLPALQHAQPEEKAAGAQAPKKKLWSPFSFTKQAKPKESPAEEAQKVKAPAIKLWNPFSKSTKPKEGIVTVAPAKGKGWAPLSFDKPAKPKEVISGTAEKPKASAVKLWNPFSKTAKPKEEVVKEAPAKGKGWTPFSFKNTAKPEAPAQEVALAKPRALPMKLWNPFSKKSKPQKSAEVEAPAEVPAGAAVSVTPEEPKAQSAQEEAAIPTTDAEKPSEITVTTDESEMKRVESYKPVEPPKDENSDDQIEVSEY